MADRGRPARARSQLLLLAAFVAGASWMGCGTSNGDPDVEPELAPPATTSTSATPDAGRRPEPDAAFSGDKDAAADGAPQAPDAGDGRCVDDDDPGSSDVTARALPDTSDAQNTAITVNGVANGAVDVDTYALAVADTAGHLLQPSIATPTKGVELCVFVTCQSGGTDLKSCTGGTLDVGTKGCCAPGPAKPIPDWNCSGSNDSARLQFRITPTGDACLPYSFSYAF
jgi:hypothetical protein